MIRKVAFSNVALPYVQKRVLPIYQNIKLFTIPVRFKNFDIKVSVKILHNSQKNKNLVAVFFREEMIGEGHGSSIQQAEKFAARKALEKYYFPQREWQEYYINNKAQFVNNPNGRNSRKQPEDLKEQKEILPSWNSQNKVSENISAIFFLNKALIFIEFLLL